MTKKVLIVDDSLGWRDFNSDALNLLHKDYFDITFASSGKKAFEIAMSQKNNPFDIILSDLHMESDFHPELAGEWFVRQIKMLKEYNNSLIIIISSMYNIESIARQLNVSYIRKSNIVSNILTLKLLLESKGVEFNS